MHFWSETGKLRLNSYKTGWWAMITVLYSQINGKWQSSEVDPHCMWIIHFWQNALSICQVAYLQHSDRYLSTLLSLPACTEPKAQAGWELRAFIWLSWEHCLGLVLYACMWSSRFPIILQRFSKPSHFEFFLLNVFIFIESIVCTYIQIHTHICIYIFYCAKKYIS